MAIPVRGENTVHRQHAIGVAARFQQPDADIEVVRAQHQHRVVERVLRDLAQLLVEHAAEVLLRAAVGGGERRGEAERERAREPQHQVAADRPHSIRATR